MDEYVFVNPSNPYEYQPKAIKYNFYQVCVFSNPTTKKYAVRCFVINQDMQFTQVKTEFLSRDDYHRFVSKTPFNKMQKLSTWTLENIPYPKVGNFMMSNSELLNSSNTSYGPAAF